MAIRNHARRIWQAKTVQDLEERWAEAQSDPNLQKSQYGHHLESARNAYKARQCVLTTDPVLNPLSKAQMAFLARSTAPVGKDIERRLTLCCIYVGNSRRGRLALSTDGHRLHAVSLDFPPEAGQPALPHLPDGLYLPCKGNLYAFDPGYKYPDVEFVLGGLRKCNLTQDKPAHSPVTSGDIQGTAIMGRVFDPNYIKDAQIPGVEYKFHINTETKGSPIFLLNGRHLALIMPFHWVGEVPPA